MRLPFELDPAIIHHIIYSQAGSIGKAVIELIMNSVDANAKTVTLSMTKEGFRCRDDGAGFATRGDVLRYFGRFGTPHEEGDATYGRFRLGRGQIMAHASTVWRSRDWQMTVDTRTMGYGYDLDDLGDDVRVLGCEIVGQWYEQLTDTELLSATQEIRDLVRYTPVAVDLNGRIITRDPRAERWDHEDEYAWYRVKVEGAVSIYNQGVLVRHDAAQQWGAGGLIVSKKAIALNVSRTEILRKTCQIWKPIAKQFGAMAREISARLGEHRKTEARREKAAHDLLAGDENVLKIFESEDVVTVLPGKRQLSMYAFLSAASRNYKGKATVTVAENAFDVPKGEAIAREGIALVVHPCTLARFGCHNTEDFRDVIDRILPVVQARWSDLSQQDRYRFRMWRVEETSVPEFIEFGTLREAYIERTVMVTEKDALDRETRRLWTALRWCIQEYAGLCSGGRVMRRGRHRRLAWDEPRKHILLGESNTMQAWTDGETYIAFNVDVVKRLRADPIKTAAHLFGLTEHEVAHQGDSIDCGHDEAFYQRYHEISISMASERQRYLHLFMQKYTYSMEGEGQRDRSRIWSEQHLIERANKGREKRGLTAAIEDLSADPTVTATVQPEDPSLIAYINAGLIDKGVCPPPPDWEEVRRRAREAQQRLAENWRSEMGEREECARQHAEYERDEYARIARLLGVEADEIPKQAWGWLWDEHEEYIKELWSSKPWEQSVEQSAFPDSQYDDMPTLEEWEEEQRATERENDDLMNRLDNEHCALVLPGETWWSLERNAAAAGFFRVEHYLQWRQGGAS
ncbi:MULTISPECIES: ATP-binding protein [unclassified Burkholderia]|uniref:ATP-binding protein n=1 Tax=unclassified Burkholderia TaxID=2613784 RepID=UPI002AB09482|nr:MULTISPECIES: ATP-binding protein [unclassified Burkholderia]